MHSVLVLRILPYVESRMTKVTAESFVFADENNKTSLQGKPLSH